MPSRTGGSHGWPLADRDEAPTEARGRLLLTGASGFIGQHLHRLLLDRGYLVRALLRPASAGRARLDRRCEVQVGELTDDDALVRALTAADAVVYAAGTVRGRHFEDFAHANIRGVEALLRALGRIDAAAMPVVLVSSLAADRPELSWYARSKRAGEMLLRGSGRSGWSILRPPAVYGPGDVEMRPLFNLVRAGFAICPGPPDQRISLLHVRDLARAVVACLEHVGACAEQSFAIDDGKPGGYDWSEIGRAVGGGRRVRQVNVPPRLLAGLARGNLLAARLFGYSPMLTPGKVRELQQPQWLCDNRAFSLATGWQPEIDLVTGACML